MPEIVSRDAWLVARKALLNKEKEHMRAGDLDLTPQGRSDAAYPDWPRRHDEYEPAARPGAAA